MIFIGEYKEFNPISDYPSISVSFSPEPYPGKNKIVTYLKNGRPGTLSTEIPHDVLTGAIIPLENLIMSDGVFSWPLALAYYVDKYYVKLSERFEAHILQADSKISRVSLKGSKGLRRTEK